MISNKVISKCVKWVIPVLLFIVYFFYWDTQHDIEGLWIYCGWMTLLFWQVFTGKAYLSRDSIEMARRIEVLEMKLLGKEDMEYNEVKKK
jgi:hypothetical protein